MDDQPENIHTTGVIEVGGTASGTWEKGVENGPNDALNWGTCGGDGDWFKADLITKIPIRLIYTPSSHRQVSNCILNQQSI